MGPHKWQQYWALTCQNPFSYYLKTLDIQMWQGMITSQELDVSRLEIREYELYGFFHLFLSYSTLIHEWSQVLFSLHNLIQLTIQRKTNSAKEFMVFHLFSELNQFFKGLQRCQEKKRKTLKLEAGRGMGEAELPFWVALTWYTNSDVFLVTSSFWLITTLQPFSVKAVAPEIVQARVWKIYWDQYSWCK